MRISDWSSDVCSSDLLEAALRVLLVRLLVARDDVDARDDDLAVLRQALRHFAGLALVLAGQDNDRVALLDLGHTHGQSTRSEEHTSELQSLMRISYAVFCLKKKKKKNHITTNESTNTNK